MRRPSKLAIQPPSKLPMIAPPERVICVNAAFRRGSVAGVVAPSDVSFASAFGCVEAGAAESSDLARWLAAWSAQGINQLALADVPITGIAPRQMPMIVRLKSGGRR